MMSQPQQTAESGIVTVAAVNNSHASLASTAAAIDGGSHLSAAASVSASVPTSTSASLATGSCGDLTGRTGRRRSGDWKRFAAIIVGQLRATSPQPPSSPSRFRATHGRRLAIVHPSGDDPVFRTNKSFDLCEIAEWKRKREALQLAAARVSSSQRAATASDVLLGPSGEIRCGGSVFWQSAPSLTCNEDRPSAQTSAVSVVSVVSVVSSSSLFSSSSGASSSTSDVTATIYNRSSVADWLRSLRHNFAEYDDSAAQCSVKSIPCRVPAVRQTAVACSTVDTADYSAVVQQFQASVRCAATSKLSQVKSQVKSPIELVRPNEIVSGEITVIVEESAPVNESVITETETELKLELELESEFVRGLIKALDALMSDAVCRASSTEQQLTVAAVAQVRPKSARPSSKRNRLNHVLININLNKAILFYPPPLRAFVDWLHGRRIYPFASADRLRWAAHFQRETEMYFKQTQAQVVTGTRCLAPIDILRSASTNDLSAGRLSSGQRTAVSLMSLNIPPERPPKPLPTASGENIYQPIWKFHTVGVARDSYSSEILESVYGDSLECCEEIDDTQWEEAKEFFFSRSRDSGLDQELDDDDNDNNDDNDDDDNSDIVYEELRFATSPFKRVAIYYDVTDPLRNYIDWDYGSVPASRFVAAHAAPHIDCRKSVRLCLDEQPPALPPRDYPQKPDTHRDETLPTCVAAWKRFLLSADYPEDEEDVAMTNIFRPIPAEEIVSKLEEDDVAVVFEEKSIPTKVVASAAQKVPRRPKKNATQNWSPGGFLSSGRISISEESVSKGKFLDGSPGSYKNLEDEYYEANRSKNASREDIQEDKDKRKEGKISPEIFGADLERLELDPIERVPRFVTECIRIIEMRENITTGGIYRASGNKNAIESVKKKMNEKRSLRKDAKYAFLQKQDIHTVTCVLKMFFRELKSPLIPDHIYSANINDAEPDQDLYALLCTIVEALPMFTWTTLRYLVKHLTEVANYSTDNWMTTANLSIVWGPCLFSSSPHLNETKAKCDITRKNCLTKVLIERYQEIFDGGAKEPKLL